MINLQKITEVVISISVSDFYNEKYLFEKLSFTHNKHIT